MDWRPEFKRLARSLTFRKKRDEESLPIISHGKTSRKFDKAVRDAYLDIPLEFREFVKSKGIDIHTGRVMTDLKILRFMTVKPTAEDSTTHVNQKAGWFIARKDKNYIAISEYQLKGGIEPLAAAEKYHQTSRLDSESWARASDVPGAVYEEFFHGLSHALGFLCASQSFKAAYEADIAALGGMERARQLDLEYYVQSREDNDPGGREEVFAHTAAHLVGFGQMTWIIAEFFPRSLQWVREFQVGFREAYHESPQAAINFAKNFGDRRRLPPATPAMEEFRQVVNRAFAVCPSACNARDYIRSYMQEGLDEAAFKRVLAHRIDGQLLQGKTKREIKREIRASIEQSIEEARCDGVSRQELKQREKYLKKRYLNFN